MSKPFILCNQKGLKALPHWLKDQHFSVYSVSFGGKGWSISLGDGEGRGYRKSQSVIVREADLLDDAESIVRNHLGWSA